MKALESYIAVVASLLLVALAAVFAPSLFSFMHQAHDAELVLIFFQISLLGVLSFMVYYLARKTIVPSFVLALLFGIVARPLLLPLVSSNTVLATLVTFGATLILFGGGLEIAFHNFRKLFLRIVSLSFVGFVITSILFSFALLFSAQIFGAHVSVLAALFLGVILASTDPAAIIPALSKLSFKNKDVKDIIVSESAMTDVIGAVLTLIMLQGAIEGGVMPDSLWQGYTDFATNQQTWVLMAKEVGVGLFFGLLGYGLLEFLKFLKRRLNHEAGVDANYFIGVPIITFAVAILFGGSGYLAAFVAGLLIMVTEHLHDTEHYFNQTIDGFLKPTIFLVLGALVNISTMLTYAPVGIMVALLFMLVIRPLAVFISLSPWLLRKTCSLNISELLFISSIRETGAIPAVLLVTVKSLGLPGLDGLLSIGMWVILLTLIVQPPLIPWIAKKLQIAKGIEDSHDLTLQSNGEPVVVLCTRGHSYARRLPDVAKWASSHGIWHVVLLSCLEDRFSEAKAEVLEEQAKSVFDGINKDFQLQDKKGLKFSVISRKGFLQDNIDQLVSEEGSVSVVFVGRKVLDYKMADVKRSQVPLFFVD